MKTKRSKTKSKVHKLDRYLSDNEGDKIKIAVVGVGGTGSHVIYNLAAINSVQEKIGGRLIHVVAYDFDTIAPHNVGKQGYFNPDTGENKAVTIITRINRAYGLSWEGEPTKYKDSHCDILITCVDSWAARESINNRPHNSKYWMDIGNGRNDGQIILSYHRTPRLMPNVINYAKKTEISTELETESCSMVQSLRNQGMFINKFMATAATEMLYKLLYEGQIDHHGLVVNLDAMRMMPLML